jgi:hypothetical protein
MPVPDMGIFKVGFEASDVTVMPPTTVPEDVGKNVTLKLRLWPALRVVGKLKALRVKLDVGAIADIVTPAPPEFVRVSVRL